ncbi:MAG: excinuclease ABC subunit B [Candidatus Yanofskybacteria bacterium RIFCSPHIGHO2_02_FULL_41_11]|uniref:UvrABC system protein B n=1 Tax=Candidatus Yanofskybacteria bacterium RIFCSPHIGHO2_02_FULL_41_11 TaxID=1802675 RepID=A0A1F8F7Y9_9BACT|nr:MAG: excinuclease ABC subunit B [Candidatus Yanofskybacteria bacterium RIFCSPHIGHO2_02_FULL_41_11]
MFKLSSKFNPTGDQPEAIKKLMNGLKSGKQHQVLLGVTGSGKTFTMAKVIEKFDRPTLVVSHNKTLAAQLYKEFKEFFPQNAVHYFVSYYDYYQPEAYIPHTDTYIEKDSKINQEIDRLRHAATQALISRDDVIIIASVSCIYNLGDPEDYKNLGLELFERKKIKPNDLVRGLLRLQYVQDIELKRGTFRKSSNEIEVVAPSGQEVVKVKFGKKGRLSAEDIIEKISIAEVVDPEELELKDLNYEKVVEKTIFPAKYWITTDDKIAVAIENIKSELQQHVKHLKKVGKTGEAARLQERTLQDIEMMRQTGYCHGIENYSRHLDFRKAGDPPYTLLDFFRSKGEFLTIVDESHISIPQLRSMYNGDHSRKSTLVEYGFRLPSAIDNRPLKFPEFQKRVQKIVYVSATPAKYELEKAKKVGIAEQLVRPTGLLDPTIEIRPTENQIEHLMENIKARKDKSERVIVTTLTKRMAEDLSEHLAENGIKVNYLHSEIKTLERLKILKDLRLGKYDVLVGVNLLREGLDLPEVSLIAILDADKEGFLRNTTTLIQTMGRAARNINGHVVMYADKLTKSINEAVGETTRRRKKQEKYNKDNDITPRTIIKEIGDFDLPVSTGGLVKNKKWGQGEDQIVVYGNTSRSNAIKQLQKLMEKSMRKFDYEHAMELREQIKKLKSG